MRGIRRPRWRLLGALMLLPLVLAPAAPAAGANQVAADTFTLDTPPLASGQIELLTLSTMPTAVTGGEVLMAVRGLERGDRLTVKRNGHRATSAFSPSRSGEQQTGLVRGLHDGGNTITAIARGPAGTRRATLRVVDHPVTGPVISGPHQEPFYCETDDAGLGAPIDRDCSIRPRVQWFYRSIDQSFHELDDPYAPYPSDTVSARTIDGKVVPFVVRVETRTINRGIARIAVLDDPHARGPDAPFRPNWNQRLTYSFGESCGVGYHQGENSPRTVLGGLPQGIDGDTIFSNLYGLSERLKRGDIVAASTLTTFGVHCNPLLSAETLMMIEEHIGETYGAIERTLSVGGSGGALQQYSAANTFPGLVDGALPVATFTDIPSTAMTVVDCGLLTRYFDGAGWTDAERAAVAGHRTPIICPDWVSSFLSRLDPQDGCSGEIPDEVRYDPETNPDGVRCTLQDGLVNLLGTNPKTGFARRPYDNVGVQYGLGALNAGQIGFEQFLELNRDIGGYDIDGNYVSARSRMSASLARLMYEAGGVVGRGALERTPVIDLATYLDLIPAADIHDVIRPFQIRARLRERGADTSQSIWHGVSAPPDAFDAMDAWLDAIATRSAGRRTARVVAASKPPVAGDNCVIAPIGARIDFPTDLTLPLGLNVNLLPGLQGSQPSFSFPLGVFIPERQEVRGGICNAAFQPASGTRIVAGGPLADDVLKCRRKPVDRADYAIPLSPSRLAALRDIFPQGVCDYARPGIGERRHSMLWPTLGGVRLHAPRELRWTVGRSDRG